MEIQQLRKYALVKPVHVPAKDECSVFSVTDEMLQEAKEWWNQKWLNPSNPPELIDNSLVWAFAERELGDVLAIDLETKGNACFAEDTAIVGIGIADSRGSCYWDIRSCDDSVPNLICSILVNEAIPTIAHNVAYDGAWLLSRGKQWVPFIACTYALYKQVANEGFLGQTWGLKDAQQEMLGWEETNEVELDIWLLDNGYIQSTERQQKQGYYWSEEQQRWATPKKAEMWRAPTEILGKYCALDAESTYSLYKYVLLPVLEQYPHLRTYHEVYFMALERILAEQQLTGIVIDVPKLAAYDSYMRDKIDRMEADFCSHPLVLPHLESQKRDILHEMLQAAPKKFKKDGTLSKNYLEWEKKFKTAMDKPWHFNLKSGPQKQWLFYEAMGYEVIVKTEKGNPAVDDDALKGFGVPGKLLTAHQEAVKELEYVEKCLEHVKLSKDGRTLHPQFKVPGTLTGRLAGTGGVNVQQIPKTKGYMECWIPRPGKVWVDCDWTALEPVVLAALSEDKALLALYGADAKPNDIYLFNGSQMDVIGAKIKGSGYDYLNPTKESIARTKKECKKERGIAKTVTLASQYGAGPAKIHQTLKLDGINIELEDAVRIHSSYHNIYSETAAYKEWLEDFWTASGGWVPNIVGRPVCCDAKLVKDIVNRVVQSSGHDIHVLYIYHLEQLLKDYSIPFNWIIADWHDQAIIEVDKKDAERVKEIMGTGTVDIVNSILNMSVQLKMSPQIVKNLAEAKIED